MFKLTSSNNDIKRAVLKIHRNNNSQDRDIAEWLDSQRNVNQSLKWMIYRLAHQTGKTDLFDYIPTHNIVPFSFTKSEFQSNIKQSEQANHESQTCSPDNKVNYVDSHDNESAQEVKDSKQAERIEKKSNKAPKSKNSTKSSTSDEGLGNIANVSNISVGHGGEGKYLLSDD